MSAVLSIGTGPEELARLYGWLEAEAAPFGLPPALGNAMHVALEEAVLNVAMHAGAPGGVTVRLSVSDAVAELVVEDRGEAFDPLAAAPRALPASLEAARPGGLGLRLLRHYCRDIAYAREDGVNRLRLRFALDK